MKRLMLFSLLGALTANMWAYDFEEGGIYYNITNEMTMTCEVTYLSYKSTDNGSAYSGNLVIPATVNYDDKTYAITGIGQYAFYECRDLISIEIPDYVTSIGTYAFYYCNSLSSITFPEYLISVGDYAFRYCTQLSEVDMGNSVSSLGSYVFRDCTSLISVAMPTSIISLGQGTFYDCTGIEEVILPNALTSIPSYSFFDCQNLASINLPDSLNSIASNGFKSCSSLSAINIPEGVSSIGANAFQYCTSLSSVNIPCLVSTIANFTFNGCTALEKIYAYNSSPATVNNANAFEGVDKESCILYVPIGSNEDYEVATVWKEFQNIVEMVAFSIETLEATDVSDTSATLHGSITEGYDDPIAEKGFVYQAESGEEQSVNVESDQDGEISCTLTGLTYGTAYNYCAYAIMESGAAAYGEEMTFTTEVPEGISSITVGSSAVEGIYSTSGQRHTSMQKGVNILRTNDGKTRKILIK